MIHVQGRRKAVVFFVVPCIIMFIIVVSYYDHRPVDEQQPSVMAPPTAWPNHTAQPFLANPAKSYITTVFNHLETRLEWMARARQRQCDLYEFGVYTGSSLIDTIKQLRALKLYDQHVGHLWGFDSFMGLPKSGTEDHPGTVSMLFSHVTPWQDWTEGNFNALAALGATSVEETMIWIKAHVRMDGRQPIDKLQLIPGFFSDSLTATLATERSMLPALFVSIDTDQYEGAMQALDWLFIHHLVVPNVTIVYYDDWCGEGFDWRLGGAEVRAHRDVTRLHRVAFEQIHYRPAFIVRSIGQVIKDGIIPSCVCSNRAC